MSESILGISVPVFGATGPKYSGKTILGGSLAPGAYPEGHPHAGKFRTLILDCEGSSETYRFPSQRVDVPAELRNKFGNQSYRQVDTFLWFRDTIATIPTDRFEVIMVDPISDIEGGGVLWAKEHPGEFGYTAAQFGQMSGIAIDCAKKMWKSICMDIATRCQVFYFTTHEKLRWDGNRPTKEKLPKGMDYLFECASLYLHLGREPDVEGQAPKPPFAEVLKSRLAFTSIGKDGELEICEILPKRLPIATKAAIIKYVKHPIGRRKTGLAADEIVQDKSLSADDKLLIEQEIALSRATEKTAHLSALELARSAMERGRESQQAYQQPPAAAAAAAATQGVSTHEAAPAKAAQMGSVPVQSQDAPPAAADPQSITQSQLSEILATMKQLFASGQAAMAWLNGAHGVTNPSLLSAQQAVNVTVALAKLLAEKKLADAHAHAPTPDTTGGSTGAPGSVTEHQRNLIRGLTEHLFRAEAGNENTRFLTSLGLNAARNLSFAQAQRRIEELNQDPRAANWVPF
jgi:hypothetical protein